MNERERKEFAAIMDAYILKFSKDKKALKQFLVDAGFITPKGNRRKPYKHLCIP